MIKLNTDVAVHTNSFSIAVVARDNLGNIRRAWSQQLNTVDPVVAKATAITWALEIVNDEGYQQIIVESDSKICIKAFSENSVDVCWKLAAFCSDVYAFSLQFVSCCFSWTKREANATAHELAKFATSLSSPFCFNDSSLPPSVFEAWQRDFLGVAGFYLNTTTNYQRGLEFSLSPQWSFYQIVD